MAVVYCDHLYDRDYLKESSTQVIEDKHLETLMQIQISSEDYKGQDTVAEYIDSHEPIPVTPFTCDYCSALDRPSVIAFLEIPAEESPVRIRQKDGEWVRDDPDVEREYPLQEMYQDSMYVVGFL